MILFHNRTLGYYRFEPQFTMTVLELALNNYTLYRDGHLYAELGTRALVPGTASSDRLFLVAVAPLVIPDLADLLAIAKVFHLYLIRGCLVL